MAGPLSKTEKMVFVSSDGAAGSRLTGDVATMMAQLGTHCTAALHHTCIQCIAAVMTLKSALFQSQESKQSTMCYNA
jgi:hypothetical protein